jgi:hypothetical protein
VPDGSDAMVILSTLANGHSNEGEDPRQVFAERLGELDHVTVSFTDAEPPQVRLSLPDLTLQCAVQAAPDGVREHLALRVEAVKPTTGHPEGAKVLTITTRHPVVSADNGTVSDTFRLLDWRESTRRAAVSPQLYATLKLVDRLEGAEKQRAATQRTRFIAARESWRCRNCRALWRPDDHERCPSCGRVFTEADRRQPEVGKVEFTVAPDDPLNLQADAAVLVEPEDEPNFVGRVSRIDTTAESSRWSAAPSSTPAPRATSPRPSTAPSTRRSAACSPPSPPRTTASASSPSCWWRRRRSRRRWRTRSTRPGG